MEHIESNNINPKTVEDQDDFHVSFSETNNKTKRKYANLKNFLDGPTLIQRSDAKEVEVIDEDKVKSTHKSAEQGVWLGVFCPIVQNIFGIVLFIRYPSLTAELGLGIMLVCVILCCLNTFFTVLCVSAIVTNGRVKNGGNYYMIARTLGPAFGGSVAILEFLANSFGSAFYFLGASETLLTWIKADITGDNLWDMRILSLCFWVISYTLNIFGLKYVARTDFFNLMIVLVGIFMMYLGCLIAGARELDDPRITGLSSENYSNNWYGLNTIDFGTAIGICYPSATGIMAGVNRSGDLKNPARDVPRGTIGAQLFTSFFYITFPILYAGVATKASLLDRTQIFNAVVCWPHPYFVSLAIIIASAGAGLQTTVNGPRIFMALCEDKLLPLSFFGKSVYRSMIMTGIISFCIIMIGKLDEVAPYLTMFYLMAYFWVCMSCLVLDLLNSPNWRPTFKYYNKLTSLLGCATCLAIMFIISWWVSLIAIAIQLALFLYILKTSRKNWGDSIEYSKVSMVINSLYKIDKLKYHVKNWRPNILVLTPKRINNEVLFSSPGTLNFLKYLNKAVGLVIYGNILEGDLSKPSDIIKSEELEKQMLLEIRKKNLRLIIKNVVTAKHSDGIMYLIHSSGLGALNPNTVIMSWPQKWKEIPEDRENFIKFIDLATKLQYHIVILKPDEAFNLETYVNTVDIWSFSYEKGLSEMLVHIMKKSKYWKACKVRLFIATSIRNNEDSEKERSIITQKILDFFRRYRLLNQIEINIVDISEDESDFFAFPLEEKIGAKEKLLLSENVFPEDQNKLKNEISTLKQLNERAKLGRSFKSFRSDVVYEAENMFVCQSYDLNKKILERSKNSDLVVINLPKQNEDVSEIEFMEFCEKLSKSLKRVIFIKNSGKEVITELV